MLKTADATTIKGTETKAREVLARWLEAADLTEIAWPITTEQAADLLTRGGGYAATVEWLETLARWEQVPNVAMWDAKDVVAAASCLEARRDWLATPNIHDPKKSHSRLVAETMLQQNPQAGFRELRRQLGNLDLEYALVLMTETDSREMREKLLAAVTILLAERECEVTTNAQEGK